MNDQSFHSGSEMRVSDPARAEDSENNVTQNVDTWIEREFGGRGRALRTRDEAKRAEPINTTARP